MMVESANLIEILINDPDWKERRKAARYLSKDKSEKTIKVLLNAVNDDDADVSYAAILSLVKLGAHELLDVIVKPKILLSENTSVRWVAAYALGFLGNTTHFGQLNELVHDSDWIVRNEAHLALEKLIGQLGNENVSDSHINENIKLLIRMLQINHIKLNAQIVDILIKLKSKSYDLLLESLSSKNEYIKIGVIQALGIIGKANSTPHLILFANDELETVREEVIKALGNIGGSLAINTIIERLGDGNRKVVEAAIETLISLGNDKLVSVILIDNLKSIYNVEIRKNILYIMGKIKNEAMIPTILENLGSSYFFIRTTAAITISKFGEEIREYINEIMITNQIPIQQLLDEAQNSKNIKTRICAIKALGELKNTQAMEIIEKLAQSDSDLVAGAAENALKKILEANWARANGAFVLGEIGGDQSIQFLLDAAFDKIPEVRFSAVSSLRKIKNSKTAERIAELALNDNSSDVRAETVRALGDIGVFTSKIKEILMRCIHDESHFVRSESARVLAKIPDDKVIDLLITALKDSSINVRKNAQNALYTIGKDIVPKVVSILNTTENKHIKLFSLNLLGLLYVKQAIPDLEKMLGIETDIETLGKINHIIQMLRLEYNEKNLNLLTDF